MAIYRSVTLAERWILTVCEELKNPAFVRHVNPGR